MKKLLVLLLVLGMASAANAAVVGLSVDGVNPSDGTELISPSETITLYVLSDNADPWMMEVSVLKMDATLGTPSPTPNAGGMAGYNDWSDGSLWIYELSTGGTEPDLPTAGPQWTMDLLSNSSISSVFTFYLGVYGHPPVSTIDFTVIPEPMTIALLGLGGLFVLRRRR